MEELLDRAEMLITEGNFADAQNVLDGIEEKNARWHYIQGKIYLHNHWTYESRKQLEIAVELEPENETYKNQLQELREMGEEAQRRFDKENKKKHLGKDFWSQCPSGCAEACGLCCCELCCEAGCEALCGGC